MDASERHKLPENWRSTQQFAGLFEAKMAVVSSATGGGNASTELL